MDTQLGICVGKTTVQCYVQPDGMHGGYGIKIIRTTDSAEREEYHCALGMTFDRAEKLAVYLYAVHAMPNEAEILIEDWLYDHADATESEDSIKECLYRE